MRRYPLQALYGLETDSLDLVIEHVNQEVEGHGRQPGVPYRQRRQRFHCRGPHARELVFQAVDEGPARSEGHEVHRVGVQLFLGSVVGPFLSCVTKK